MMKRILALVSVFACMAALSPAPARAACACGTSVCATLPPPYSGVCAIASPDFLTFSDQSTMNWPAFTGSCATSPQLYDVARGDLACLRGSCDIGPGSCATCFVGDTTLLTASDSTAPALGQGYFYVLRADAGSWNSNGLGQITEYDPLIAALGTCP